MNLETYIRKVVELRCKYDESRVTPDEAVDIYLREGIVVDEADWRYDEYLGCIWLDGCPRIFNVPNDFTLGELYHNVAIVIVTDNDINFE